eukprot:scaffold49012_cov37-Tisochrysis_lutea.AAC.2
MAHLHEVSRLVSSDACTGAVTRIRSACHLTILHKRDIDPTRVQVADSESYVYGTRRRWDTDRIVDLVLRMSIVAVDRIELHAGGSGQHANLHRTKGILLRRWSIRSCWARRDARKIVFTAAPKSAILGRRAALAGCIVTLIALLSRLGSVVSRQALSAKQMDVSCPSCVRGDLISISRRDRDRIVAGFRSYTEHILNPLRAEPILVVVCDGDPVMIWGGGGKGVILRRQ